MLLTDLHLGVRQEDSSFLNANIELYKEILNVCEELNINTIYNLGDFFNNRNSIGLKTMEAAKEMASLVDDYDVKHLIIIGNHDCRYVNSIFPTSLSFFHKYKNTHVITEPTIMGDVTLVPWGVSPRDITPNKFLMGHFEINAFPMNDMRECGNAKFNIEDFSHFGKVYSGHFHTASKKENIEYIGSALQLTFHDVGHKRGYYILKDGSFYFREFKKSPKFVVLSSEDDIEEENITGNFVKLVFEKDYGNTSNSEVLESVEKYNPLKVFTDFSKISIDVEGEEELSKEVSVVDNEHLLYDYIDNKIKLPSHIKKSILFKMIENFSKETEK